MTCPNNPTLESLNLEDNQMALRVVFPLVINSLQPLGNPATAPYNIEAVLLQQISSWIPNMLRDNNYDVNCNIIVTDRANGFYLIRTHPTIFSEYLG